MHKIYVCARAGVLHFLDFFARVDAHDGSNAKGLQLASARFGGAARQPAGRGATERIVDIGVRRARQCRPQVLCQLKGLLIRARACAMAGMVWLLIRRGILTTKTFPHTAMELFSRQKCDARDFWIKKKKSSWAMRRTAGIRAK